MIDLTNKAIQLQHNSGYCVSFSRKNILHHYDYMGYTVAILNDRVIIFKDEDTYKVILSKYYNGLHPYTVANSHIRASKHYIRGILSGYSGLGHYWRYN